jgi:serine/threonine protein kinase
VKQARGPTDPTEIAAALCDGEAVDWARVETGSSPRHRELLTGLKAIERIASLHASLPPVGVFERSLHDSLLRTSEPRVAPPGAPPAIWGPLTIGERIGSGTYADVYRARDPRLDRPVALKLLRHRDATDAAVESETIEEARLLARVHQENVVTVYGADRIDGRAGIWMELVDGPTLEQELAERGPFPADQLIAIGTALCRALAAVHAAGLLHRDVKAQNVMRGRDGRILLTDFGTGREVARMASARELAGTPLYLAPEILAGQDASVATDLYSLAVLLYHLATGGFPVTGRSLRDLRDAQARRAHVAVRDRRADVPERLASVIDRASAIDSARRPSSAIDLERALTGAARATISTRTTVVTVLLLVATLAIVTWVWWSHAPSAPPLPSRVLAVLPLKRASPSTPIIQAAAVSPDGRYLLYADILGVHLMTVANGEEHPLVVPGKGTISGFAWTPDSSTLLASRSDGVWRASIESTTVERIVEGAGLVSVSPNGRQFAFTADNQKTIRLMSMSGANVAEIVPPEAGISHSPATWSRDGQRIAFVSHYGPPRPIDTIETVRTDGSGRTTVASNLGVRSIVWMPDGWLLVARVRPNPTPRADNLWAIKVNPQTGQPESELTRLLDLPHVNFLRPHVTASATQVAFLGNDYQVGPAVANWDPESLKLTGLYGVEIAGRLAGTDMYFKSWAANRDALVVTMLPDLFEAAYQLALDTGEPQVFLQRPKAHIGAAVSSPDGSAIFYVPQQTGALMRQPASGPAEYLFPIQGPASVKCPVRSRGPCVTAGLRSTGTLNQVELTPFDPATGRPSASIESPPAPSDPTWDEPIWDLSPDGTQAVTLEVSGKSFRLWVANLKSRKVDGVPPVALPGATGVAWNATRQSWIVTRHVGETGSEVVVIDQQGRATPVWHDDFRGLFQPLVSPDGKRIAFQSFRTVSTIFTLRGF